MKDKPVPPVGVEEQQTEINQTNKNDTLDLNDSPNATAQTDKNNQADLIGATDQKDCEKKSQLPVGLTVKKVVSVEGFVCLGIVIAVFVALGIVMGMSNLVNTMFNTAYDLLTKTVWYIMAITVLMGAFAEVLTEFGVISLANKVFAPLMKPLFGMPGATSMAILASFLSDNPAVLTLADNTGYRRYFKKYQLGALTNIGTTYGMGLIVLVTIMATNDAEGNSLAWASLVGFLAVFLTSILLTRVMLLKTKKIYGKDAPAVEDGESEVNFDFTKFREVRKGSVGSRFISAFLDGGGNGVKIGISVIPGVLVIATLVLILSNTMPAGGYTGAAGEGVGLIPLLGNWLSPVLKPLFGFSNPSDIAVPLTALGSAGASLGVIKNGMVLTPHTAAVFTAMCMFWSGYLSTHVSMLDSLKMRELTGWSILFHTVGGIVAGLVANGLVSLILLF